MVLGVYLDPSANSGFFAFNLDAKSLGARREETPGASRSSNNFIALSQDGLTSVIPPYKRLVSAVKLTQC